MIAKMPILDLQAELNEAYRRAKELQPAYDEYVAISNRIIWLERKTQGLNEANERYAMGFTTKDKKKSEKAGIAKNPSLQAENDRITRFRFLSKEKQEELFKLMEAKK
jgi:hypothetical protein